MTPGEESSGGALRRLLDVLACPVCAGALQFAGTALRCPQGHSFDLAKQGYASLLPGKGPGASADTAAMVRARADFLAAGHYTAVADAVARCTAEICPAGGVVLDAGAGTGYYLAAALGAVPDSVGLGLDASKYALRRAARAHPRAGAAACDIWQGLPLHSAAVDVLLTVFAPRNTAEFRRVLRTSGRLVVVRPASRHLAELRRVPGVLAVDPAKQHRLEEGLAADFAREREVPLEFGMALDARSAENAVLMGPSAHHADPGDLRRALAGAAAPLQVTASLLVSVYRPV